mmetsp:Transcript_6128/g.18494  ORF Transcript_6128/g.18494 Transcript_6128/m.18494 type:complete len:234 (-) Transcript_6128:462-1163(-)
MMISLIVVALVGIGFTRLTMLALELRDNYEDNPSDEPVDLSRKRVDAHNKMVSMAKPEKMLVKGDNRYEPKADGSFSKGDGESSYSAMLASTEATLQAGFDALFSYGQAESVEPPEESAAVAADEAVKDIGEESDASATQPVSKPAKIADLEAAQSAVDPTDVCTICFEKAKNAVILGCGHGGVCYNCSIDVYVTSGHCPFCRHEIGQILTVGFAHVSTDSAGNSFVPVVGPR